MKPIGQIFPAGFEGLKIFAVGQSDRSSHQLFAGRKEIISAIENTCSSSWEDYTSGRSQLGGGIRLVKGAPGVGKTAMLVHLHDKWAEGSYITKCADESARMGPTPVMLYLGSRTSSNSIETICSKLMDTVEAGRGKDSAAAFRESIRGSGGFDTPFEGAQAESEKVKQLACVKAMLDAVARSRLIRKWKRPVVIGVDDSQNLHGDRFSPVGEMLQELHTGYQDFPITAVLTGCSDSLARIQELGVMRLSSHNVQSLNCLEHRELEELKEVFCSLFQIGLGKHVTEFDHMLAVTNGWPSHIQNCLRAFSQYYIEAEGDIDKVDFFLVELRSLEFRARYFESCMSNEMLDSMDLLSSVMQYLTRPQLHWDVIDFIEQQAKLAKCPTEKLPKGMAVEDYCDHLIHRGALQRGNCFSVDCPIPSFRQFLIERPNREQFQSHHREVFH